jgi:hypothetical protein
MNPLDDQLDRLFRAARQTGPEPVAAPAFGLETRVMAAWRSAQAGEAVFWNTTLLVRGLIVAGVIMAASFWPALNSSQTTSNPFAEYLQLTDSTVTTDVAP